MRRVFVPEDCMSGDRVRLTGSEAHYLRNVLRLGAGGEFSAVLPGGTERVATIAGVGGDWVEAALGAERGSPADPSVDVRLFPGLVKARKLELVIQKCTELGVSAICPVLCERSVPRPDEDKCARKLERWRRIAEEAARQCGRTSPPEIALPVTFSSALDEVARLGGTALILAPDARDGVSSGRRLLAPDAAQPVSVFVGPEGGFTPDEVQAAEASGIRAVSLGRRILRAETAAITICALLGYESGELA